ncbi:MAG: DNA polymerase III subunit gamma/tau [Bacteroidota bacterium]|nr:DNA polymerase III subunit gamma/tau [Bacteroidota bacterium]
MPYQVTARKWRPMVFEDVIGQTHVTNTLRNALATNRLAHAFLFSGGRGCGKTSTARILAKAVNCLNPKDSNPCNECEVCEEINSGRSMDIIEIDGASTNSVDDVRSIREAARYTPSRGKKKVYIIDEVHMLSKGAFNALLKVLEEPPPHILFIFATTEIQKVPSTIISRCQRYDFRRISIDDISKRLRFIAGEEKISIDDDSLLFIAKKADGAMRDAQSIFDQVVSYCGTTITAQQTAEALNIVDQEFFFRVSDIIKAHDTKAGLDLVDEIVRDGFDLKEFAGGLAEHFRNLLVARSMHSGDLIETSEAYRRRYLQDSNTFNEQDLLRLIKTVSELESALRYSTQPRFRFEVSIVQMTKMEQSVRINELLAQIDELKKKWESIPPKAGLEPNGPPSLSFAPKESSTGKKATYSLSIASPGAVSERSFGFESRTTMSPLPSGDAHRSLSSEQRIENPLGTSLVPGTAPKEFSTMQHVQTMWEQVVADVRAQKISVGTVLAESHPLEIVNGALRIACPDEYHSAAIKRNGIFLTEKINQTLNTRLRLESVVQPFALPEQRPDSKGSLDKPGAAFSSETSLTFPESIAPNPSPADLPVRQAGSEKIHSIIETLERDFGAERLS